MFYGFIVTVSIRFLYGFYTVSIRFLQLFLIRSIRKFSPEFHLPNCLQFLYRFLLPHVGSAQSVCLPIFYRFSGNGQLNKPKKTDTTGLCSTKSIGIIHIIGLITGLRHDFVPHPPHEIVAIGRAIAPSVDFSAHPYGECEGLINGGEGGTGQQHN